MEDEIILKDNDLAVLLPRKSFCKGHIILVPLKEYSIIEEVPSELLTKIFQVANKLSSVLFESLGCQGTNILVQNGVPAGQFNKLFSVNILPRYENDGLKLEWTPKQADEESLKKSLDAFSTAEKGEQQEKFLESQKEKAAKKEDSEKVGEDDYLAKSIDRIP